MNEEFEVETPKPSLKERVMNAATNRKVQIGLTVALTATATAALLLRGPFKSVYTLDEVGDVVNDVIKDMETNKS